MGRFHHWYFLKDKEGRPILDAGLNLYLTTTKTEAVVYNSAAASASIDQSTWVTGASGFFNFFIGDQFEILYTGYEPTQEFDLSWATSAAIYSGDEIPSGTIDNLQLLPKIFTVNENSQNPIRNKMVSNILANKWDEHPDKTYAQEPHDIFPIDETDSQDVTVNKVVNDDLMNRMNSFPFVSAGQITISTSGALISQHTLTPSDWEPSGNGVAYVDFEHNLFGRNQPYPIVQVYNIDTKDLIMPVRIQDIDDTNLRIAFASGGITDLAVSVLGEIRVTVL